VIQTAIELAGTTTFVDMRSNMVFKAGEVYHVEQQLAAYLLGMRDTAGAPYFRRHRKEEPVETAAPMVHPAAAEDGGMVRLPEEAKKVGRGGRRAAVADDSGEIDTAGGVTV
jgi:hypothetical protein